MAALQNQLARGANVISTNLQKIKIFTLCNASLLQDYCKDWAEQMIVSVVLVCSEPLALHMLHSK